MPGFRFERPVGAGADVKELEYIIALQQTSSETRSNATVSSLDILALLKSRYGLTITHEEAAAVIHSLGGGDPLPIEETAEEKAPEESNKKVGLLGSLSNQFRRSTGNGSAENETKEATSEGKEKETTRKPEAMSKMMMRLKVLHAMQQQSPENPTHDKGMQDLHDEVAADLRAQVIANTRKATSTHNLQKETAAPLDAAPVSSFEQSATKAGAVEVDEDGIAKFPDAEFSLAEEVPRKSVTFDTQGTRDDDDLSGDKKPNHEPVAEYLDLVQVLSTLLIPKFANIAYNVPLEEKERQAKKDGAIDEPSSHLDGRMQQQKSAQQEEEEELSLWTRLSNRFVNYGRRKLQINDEDPCPFSASEILEMGHKALLKSLPTTEDGDPVLDELLVQYLLISQGEIERANNPELVQAMVLAAQQSPSGLLDMEALRHAISSDVTPDCWDPATVETPTTYFYDVFGIPLPSVKTKLRATDSEATSKTDVEAAATKTAPREEQPEAENDDIIIEEDVDTIPKPLPIWKRCCKRVFPVMFAIRNEKPDFSTAFLGVDMITDVSASVSCHVLIWVSYIMIALLYGQMVLQLPDTSSCDGSVYGCMVSTTIASWLAVAAILIALGFYHILPLSVGNNPADQSPRRQFFSGFVAIANSIVPFIVTNWYEGNSHKINNSNVEDEMNYEFFDTIQIATLIVGLILALHFVLKGFVLFCVDHNHPHLLPGPLQALVSTASWRGEVKVYNAAKRKIARTISNALRMHVSEEQTTGQSRGITATRSTKLAMSGTRDQTSRNFILHGETKEDVGGILWTYWRLFDGSLFNEHGIWINTRLLVIQTTQVFVALLLTAIWLVVAVQGAIAADNFREDLAEDDLPDWIMDIFPTGAMIEGSFIPAAFVAMGTMIITIVIYVPSSVCTILKFRGKVLPSLGSPYFEKYREGVDMTYMNTANAIWGMAGASVLFYLAVGLAIFLFLWPITQELMLILTAWGIGLGITIGIKMVVTTICRKLQFRAYYRIRPAAARLTALALECWHIGLAASVVIARVTQFLLAALFWVGRIDVPFLSEDVVLFGYGFDLVPAHYFKDLLVHEAHRHPYIEQLSQMYLMKLRYGDRFLTDAGTVWRQLLVLAIFPWLAKYRVFSDERRIHAEFDGKEDKAREERENDPYLGVKEAKDGVVDLGVGVGDEVVDAGQELYGAGEDIVMELGKVAKKGANVVRRTTTSTQTPN